MKKYLLLLLTLSWLHNAYASQSASAGQWINAAKHVGLSSSSSSKNKADKDPNHKAKIEAAHSKLQSLQDWNQQKKIIREAVERDGIHPDELELEEGTSLLHATKNNDIFCAEFLLLHGANANIEGRGLRFYLLSYAQTIAMAKLLYQYGADQTIKNDGQGCFEQVILQGNPNLIPWYVSYGVSVNGKKDKIRAPLHILCSVIFISEEERLPIITQCLANEGALLNIPDLCYPYLNNVPQHLKRRITGEHQKFLEAIDSTYRHRAKASYERFLSLKEILLHASNYRCYGLKKDLWKYLPIEGIPDIIVAFYIAPEPSYQELEDMPIAGMSLITNQPKKTKMGLTKAQKAKAKEDKAEKDLHDAIDLYQGQEKRIEQDKVALFAAITSEQNDPTVIDPYITAFTINSTDEDMNTPLLKAIRCNKIAIIIELIAHWVFSSMLIWPDILNAYPFYVKHIKLDQTQG